MKVSVITPTYNRPELLRQAIDSFLAQDYEDKEMIIVMDGCDKYFDDYVKLSNKLQPEGRFDFVRIPHSGCPTALNKGVRYSAGDFICILADDDLLNGPDSLTKRVNAFDKDTEVIYTGAYNVDIKNKVLSTTIAEPVDKKRIFQQDYINIQSMMWRRSVHDKIGFFSEDLINNEDWEFKIKCLQECNVKAVDMISVRSRYHGLNKSITDRKMTNECAEKLIKRMKEKYL